MTNALSWGLAWRRLGLCLLAACVMNAAFVALEAVVLLATDDAAITRHLQGSIDGHVFDRWEYPTSPYGHILHKYDLYTECIALGTNLGNAEVPVLRRVAETPHVRVYPDEMYPCQVLHARLVSGSAHAAFPYPRYWHGHQVYLRPLLAGLRLDRIRRLNAVLVYASVALLIAALVPAFGMGAAPALFIPMVLFTDLLTLPAVTVHALALAWTFLAAAIFGRLLGRHDEYDPVMVGTAFVGGGIYGFFDLLFNPPFGAALLALLSLARSAHLGRGSLDALLRSAVAAALWLGGYAAALFGKWLFAAAVLGWRLVFDDIVSGALFRIAGGDEGKASGLTVLALMGENAGGFGILVGWAFAAAILLFAHRRRRLDANELRTAALLQAPLVILLAWVLLLRNHSVVHAGFVSRPFVLATVLPILAALHLAAGRAQRASA